MVCLELKPGAAGWKAQTNPLSYGGNPEMAEKLANNYYSNMFDK